MGKVSRASKLRTKKRQEEMRKSRRFRKHGITQEIFGILLYEQGGACAICETSDFGPRGSVIDHDHESGQVRGILCWKCNTAIGLLGDESSRLRKALIYLRMNEMRQCR